MQTIHLNSNNFRLFPRVYMVQNDTGRDLKMVLDDITLAGTETGAVAIKRSDLSFYTISATLVAADNAFTADMTQALTQPGLTECQLKVTAADDTVVSSYTFVIFVQPSTDGVPEEQLGYSIDDLMAAAALIAHAGFTTEAKNALLACFEKVAWIDDQGQTYVDALEEALFPPANLVSISAVYTQTGIIYDTDNIGDLKDDLVVTAHYDDGSSEVVTSYTLSGTLTEGTSTITVSYGGMTDTFDVTVTHKVVPVTYYTSNMDVVDGYYYNSAGEFIERASAHYDMTMRNGMYVSFLGSTLTQLQGTYRRAVFVSDVFDNASYASGTGISVSDTGAADFRCGWENPMTPTYEMVVGELSPDLFVQDGYVIKIDAVGETENANYTSTDYIAIDANASKYIFVSPGTTGSYFARIGFYDANKAFISALNSNGAGVINAVTDIPSGAAYFRMSKRVGSAVGHPIISTLD